MGLDEQDDRDVIREAIVNLHESELEGLANELPDGLELSDEFIREMDYEFEKLKAKRRRMINTGKAACFAVIISIGALFITSGNEVGANCLEFIREFIDGGMTKFQGNDSIKEHTDESDINADIKGYKLSYVPEGFELVEDDTVEEEGTVFYDVYKNNETMIVYKCFDSVKSDIYIDNENYIHKVIVLDNGAKCDYYIGIKEKHRSIIAYRVDRFICCLSMEGYDDKLNYDEILKMVNGLEPQN